MNMVDLVLLFALAYVAVRGFRQGALSQGCAFAGAAAGLILGAAAAPGLAQRLVDQPGPELALLTMVALLGMIALGQGVGLALGLWLRTGVERIGAGGADQAAGVLVGWAGLVLTVWLLASVLVNGPSVVLAQALNSSRFVNAIAAKMPPPPDLFGRVSGYLDQQGFPRVFAGLEGPTAPPVGAPSDAAVNAAVERGQVSAVQVEAEGCGGISSGSGFVTQPGFIVTNAHVVAGGQSLRTRDRDGAHEAVAIHVDPRLDLAVLSSPGTVAPPIAFVNEPVGRGSAGATLGYPGGQRDLRVRAAIVRGRIRALGRDIYGQDTVQRQVLTLSADVERGDSGGPFVTGDGLVGGVVFAASASEPGTGYALTADQVTGDVGSAIARNTIADTGSCRY